MSTTQITTLPPVPRRAVDAHKGTFGRALLVAGSPGMSGAAVLCGLAALRSGAGLVQVACPRSIQNVVAASEPSYMTLALPEDDAGKLSSFALQPCLQAVEQATAMGIGPGLGNAGSVGGFVTAIYRTAAIPLVVDADGLNALAAAKAELTRAAGPRILTPHPGEFARLTGKSTSEVRDQRETLAVEFAEKWNVVLVLKGAASVVTDGKQLFVNTTGNSGMATGGTGDVLTGLITGLLAQGMAPFAAAQLGVFLHGRAGDLAAKELSQPGLIASDLIQFLGPAWKSL